MDVWKFCSACWGFTGHRLLMTALECVGGTSLGAVLGVEGFIFHRMYWLGSENIYADIMIYFLVPDE